MNKLYYFKDNLDMYITEEYVLTVDSNILLDYIKKYNDHKNVTEFDNFYNNEDVENIINFLEDKGINASLLKTGRCCDIDDLM